MGPRELLCAQAHDQIRKHNTPKDRLRGFMRPESKKRSEFEARTHRLDTRSPGIFVSSINITSNKSVVLEPGMRKTILPPQSAADICIDAIFATLRYSEKLGSKQAESMWMNEVLRSFYVCS